MAPGKIWEEEGEESGRGKGGDYDSIQLRLVNQNLDLPSLGSL